MKFGKFLVIAAILGLAAGASAQVPVFGPPTTVHTGGIFDWVVTSGPTPVGDGSENLVAMVLSIVNNTGNAGNNPQAIDAKASGYAGINGLLHSEYSLALATLTPDNTDAFADGIDTHFLLAGVPHAFDSATGAPQEDPPAGGPSAEAPLTGGTLGGLADTDFGTNLTATMTLTGAAGPQWDLAQIVTPWNSPVFVQMQVATSQGVKDTVAEFTFVPEIIPTPAALPMGLMGLALLRRRR
jgi:uncharacterized protein (TIGR03382 family)